VINFAADISDALTHGRAPLSRQLINTHTVLA
jgi:hypothetical protein